MFLLVFQLWDPYRKLDLVELHLSVLVSSQTELRRPRTSRLKFFMGSTFSEGGVKDTAPKGVDREGPRKEDARKEDLRKKQFFQDVPYFFSRSTIFNPPVGSGMKFFIVFFFLDGSVAPQGS